jgi:aryl sulfotransferase
VPGSPREPIVRYRSIDEDSARWRGFRFRPGDIVISTRSKSGTTWVQMICALLVFQRPELPAPLVELSPWLDWLAVPRDEIWAQLEAQHHRRVIKTHTPLDGLPLDERATYVVVGRHPLDMAVSLYHQGHNLDRERLAALTGLPPRSERTPSVPLADWLLGWIEGAPDPRDELDSLPGVLWHLSDAWARRQRTNVVLLHYDDLCRDLEGQMRRLAWALGIAVPEDRWAELTAAASFERMRAEAHRVVPDPGGILKEQRAFFRRGSSGAGREALSVAQLNRYHARATTLAAEDLLLWVHREPSVTPAPPGAASR